MIVSNSIGKSTIALCVLKPHEAHSTIVGAAVIMYYVVGLALDPGVVVVGGVIGVGAGVDVKIRVEVGIGIGVGLGVGIES